MNKAIAKAALVTCVAMAASSSAAHVVLGTDMARTATYFRADFRVGHGCAGSPTKALTVFIPAGVLVAKPQPKPGWTVETHQGALEKPGKVHGREVREAVDRVRWSGGSLPDEHFDDFSLLLRLPDAPGTLGFRVLQECEKGQADWAQPPGPGKERARYPMPLLKVTPAGDKGHRH